MAHMAASVLLSFVSLLSLAEGVFVNDLDAPFTFQCPPLQTISRIYSVHDNHAEDRRFDFTCRDIISDTSGLHPTCFWTDFLNKYDELVHYSCPTSNYLAGMGSVHNNNNEDRIFKFYCCSIPEIHELDCGFSGWVNDYDQKADFSIDQNKVIKGMISRHDSGPEDRRFEYEVCRVIKLSDDVVVG